VTLLQLRILIGCHFLQITPVLTNATTKGSVGVTWKMGTSGHFSTVFQCVQEQDKIIEKSSGIKVVLCWPTFRKGTGRNFSYFTLKILTAWPRLGGG
jgi:hypothetical protein